MTERWELRELIGQTLEGHNITASEQTVVAVLDSIEDLIRADERERRESWAELVAKADGAILADLRAQVAALASPDPEYNNAIRDVLALIDGSSDE